MNEWHAETQVDYFVDFNKEKKWFRQEREKNWKKKRKKKEREEESVFVVGKDRKFTLCLTRRVRNFDIPKEWTTTGRLCSFDPRVDQKRERDCRGHPIQQDRTSQSHSTNCWKAKENNDLHWRQNNLTTCFEISLDDVRLKTNELLLSKKKQKQKQREKEKEVKSVRFRTWCTKKREWETNN